MNVTMLELVEHALNRFVIVCERFAYAGRQACIVDKFSKTFTGQRQVIAFPVLMLAVSRR